MATDRLGILKQMLAQDANNSFARYGLGMEYAKSGEFSQAIAEFRTLLERDSNYAAAYFHGGQALEKLGRIEEARACMKRASRPRSVSATRTRARRLKALSTCYRFDGTVLGLSVTRRLEIE